MTTPTTSFTVESEETNGHHHAERNNPFKAEEKEVDILSIILLF
jgi:hypothetical protein